MERQVGDVDTSYDSARAGPPHLAPRARARVVLRIPRGPHHGHSSPVQVNSHPLSASRWSGRVANGEATAFRCHAPCHRSRQRLIRETTRGVLESSSPPDPGLPCPSGRCSKVKQQAVGEGPTAHQNRIRATRCRWLSRAALELGRRRRAAAQAGSREFLSKQREPGCLRVGGARERGDRGSRDCARRRLNARCFWP